MTPKDNAIFLDTADLSYEYAPLVLDGAKIVVTNSNVKHSLVNSAYNERRSECEKALEELQTVVEIKGLGDLPHGGRELIHNATVHTIIIVLRVLSDLRQIHIRHIKPVQILQHITGHYFQRCGGG